MGQFSYGSIAVLCERNTCDSWNFTEIIFVRFFDRFGVGPMSSLHHVPSKKAQLYLVPAGFFFMFVTVFSMSVDAGEIVMSTDSITFNETSMPGASCDCEGNRQPPWHGNVGGRCCNRPCCPPPTHFHADAYGQLRAKDEAKSHCVALPPAFPRFNGWRHTGRLPSPTPIAMPRCHHCGMPIPVGM